MATKYWLGIARKVAQVTAVQVTAYDAATTYQILVNGVAIAEVLGTTDVNGTASALQAAWETERAAANPYAVGITATVSTDTVTLTGDPGLPFTVTTAAAGGTGTIAAASTTTAATGPNFWSDADNWSTGAVPVATDDVIIANSSVSILFDLDQNTIALTSLTVDHTFSGKLGLPKSQVTQSADGETTSSQATEYRETYLKIGADTVAIGRHTGAGNPQGSRRLKINNTRAAASACVVFNTASISSDLGLPAVRYLAAHASATLDVRAAPGGVGVAVEVPGETATIGTVSVTEAAGAVTNVYTGAGLTVTTVNVNAGDVTINAAGTISAVNVRGGKLRTYGRYLISAVNVFEGTLTCSNAAASGASVTTMTISGGAVRGDQAMQLRTWTTVTLNAGALTVDSGRVTITTLSKPSGLKHITVAPV